MFPKLDLDLAREEIREDAEEESQGISYLYDFKKKDFVIRAGSLIEIEGAQGVRVWIEKILRTERFKFDIYEDYGISIENLLKGKKIPVLLLQSELKRQLVEAMSKNNEIEEIQDFKVEQEMATLYISFTVILKSGESFIQEVSF